MIDNTHVIVLSGSGRDMIPVPEMAAFADRFGFTLEAHAGDTIIAAAADPSSRMSATVRPLSKKPRRRSTI